MADPAVVVSGFDRPNIALAVRTTRSHQPEAQALDDRSVEVAMSHESPMLVYALSHARCESLADRLNKVALRASAYHAGMPAARRAQVQDDFFTGKLDVVVATSAFGMGIDKPDVRTVVHAGVPGSLDEYYQEIGRAGRDGKPASAVLVFDPRSVRIPRLLAARSVIPAEVIHRVVDALEAFEGPTPIADIAKATGVSQHNVERIVTELDELGILTPQDEYGVVTPRQLPKDAATRLLQAGQRRHAIVASRIEAARLYAESPHCRRAELLSYFGDHYEPPCGRCDNDDHGASPSVPSVRPSFPAPAGQRVRHRLWGMGTLLSRDDHELVVVFDSLGYRHLTPTVLTNGILTLA
jgi:ATP-dependent DNA helicase RecQ